MIDAPIREKLIDGIWTTTKIWPKFFQDVVKLLRAFENGVYYKAVNVSSNYTMKANDCAIIVDATAGPVNINLLPAADCRGKRITVKKVDATGNGVSIDPSGVETIDGSLTVFIAVQYQSADLVPDQTSSVWWLL